MVCATLAPGSQAEHGVGRAHAEIVVEMSLQRLIDALLDLLDQVRDGVRRATAEGVNHRQRVHVAFLGDALDQIQEPVDIRARGIDGKEDRVKAVLLGVLGCLDRQTDGFFQRPFVGVLDDVIAGRHFHDDAIDAAIDRPLDVFFHAAAEGEDLRAEACA